MRAADKDTVRAGVFVLVGVAVFTLAIFLLGQKSALFSRTTTLFVEFEDVSGLAVGAPVRLAGLEIGSVASVRFSPDLRERRTRIELLVQSAYLPRIRSNSEAFIDSNGLLGDKIVNISMGEASAAELSEGATLRAGTSVSFEALSSTAARALASAAGVVGAVEQLVGDARTTQLRDDVARTAASLARLLDRAEHGPGIAHRLLYDQKSADDVAAVIANANPASGHVRSAVARLDAVLSEIERGDGSLHALVYGSEGKQALANVASAAAELSALTAAARQGNGVLHTLIYDEQHGSFVRDLDQLAAGLNRIVQDVERGRGTVGGLLRDPTVYERLTTMLGDVQRNVLFKALVRFTIDRDDLRRVDPSAHVSTMPTADGAQSARAR